jgi:hypothetical protein
MLPQDRQNYYCQQNFSTRQQPSISNLHKGRQAAGNKSFGYSCNAMLWRAFKSDLLCIVNTISFSICFSTNFNG